MHQSGIHVGIVTRQAMQNASNFCVLHCRDRGTPFLPYSLISFLNPVGIILITWKQNVSQNTQIP